MVTLTLEDKLPVGMKCTGGLSKRFIDTLENKEGLPEPTESDDKSVTMDELLEPLDKVTLHHGAEITSTITGSSPDYLSCIIKKYSLGEMQISHTVFNDGRRETTISYKGGITNTDLIAALMNEYQVRGKNNDFSLKLNKLEKTKPVELININHETLRQRVTFALCKRLAQIKYKTSLLEDEGIRSISYDGEKIDLRTDLEYNSGLTYSHQIAGGSESMRIVFDVDEKISYSRKGDHNWQERELREQGVTDVAKTVVERVKKGNRQYWFQELDTILKIENLLDKKIDELKSRATEAEKRIKKY